MKIEVQVKTDVITANEPVSLAEAKNYLKLPSASTSDDTILLDLIRSAREQCEQYCGRAFAPKTLTVLVSEPVGTEIELPYPPHTEVSSVERVYTDDTDNLALTENTDYYVNGLTDYVLTVNKFWSTSTVVTGYEIEYTCGYDAIPAALKEAVLITLDYNYYNRGAAGVLPSYARELMRGYRKTDWL
jgi:uncharacterized phiE125 gp8 family phage protein